MNVIITITYNLGKFSVSICQPEHDKQSWDSLIKAINTWAIYQNTAKLETVFGSKKIITMQNHENTLHADEIVAKLKKMMASST